MYFRRRFSFHPKTFAILGVGLIVVVFAVLSFGIIGKGKTIVSPVPDSSGVKIIFVTPSITPEASVAGQMEESAF